MSTSGFTISVQWRNALCQENGEPYYFPDKFTPFFRDAYSVPGIYRWRVIKGQPGDKEQIYIGESEELSRRIQRVLTPSLKAQGSNTNHKLHQIFKQHISSSNRRIVIDIADIEPFELNGIRFDSNALGDRFKRRALENLLLVIAQQSGEFEGLEYGGCPAWRSGEGAQNAQTARKTRDHQGLPVGQARIRDSRAWSFDRNPNALLIAAAIIATPFCFGSSLSP